MVRKALNWYYGSASIRKKLVISYVLLITIPIIVLGLYSFQVSKKNMEKQTEIVMHNNVNQLVSELETTLQRENDNIRYLAYNAKFRQTLKNSHGNSVEIAKVLNEVVEPIFWYFITSDTNLKAIEIYSPYISGKVGSFLKSADFCKEEPWFQYHLTNYNTLWSFENGELFATRTLLDAPTSSEFIGVLKLNVYPAQIFKSVEKTNFMQNGILITDAAGKTIFFKESGYPSIDSEVRQLALTGNLTEGDQGDYLLNLGQIESGGWQIYYYVAKDMISGQLNGIIRSTLLMVGACLVVIVCMISFLSRVLSRRILELKEYAEQVSEGKFDLVASTVYTDEIGAVSKSLQMMNDRLKDMIARVYQAELDRKAMELKALQAMINPHFLYNSLSSIKWKAIRTGQDEISDLTGLLAKFYRTSLNGGQQITLVRNELENIKAYIELQQRTHDNQFEVVYRLQEDSLDYSMPNFLLQPIVENAIEHGIDSQEEDEGKRGLLIVEYEAEEEYLYFRIQNNGPQMDLERLTQILGTPGKGYGIFNIQERIRLYYGDGCGVYACITEEGYTCFMVKILKNPKEF